MKRVFPGRRLEPQSTAGSHERDETLAAQLVPYLAKLRARGVDNERYDHNLRQAGIVLTVVLGLPIVLLIVVGMYVEFDSVDYASTWPLGLAFALVGVILLVAQGLSRRRWPQEREAVLRSLREKVFREQLLQHYLKGQQRGGQIASAELTPANIDYFISYFVNSNISLYGGYPYRGRVMSGEIRLRALLEQLVADELSAALSVFDDSAGAELRLERDADFEPPAWQPPGWEELQDLRGYAERAFNRACASQALLMAVLVGSGGFVLAFAVSSIAGIDLMSFVFGALGLLPAIPAWQMSYAADTRYWRDWQNTNAQSIENDIFGRGLLRDFVRGCPPQRSSRDSLLRFPQYYSRLRFAERDRRDSGQLRAIILTIMARGLEDILAVDPRQFEDW